MNLFFEIGIAAKDDGLLVDVTADNGHFYGAGLIWISSHIKLILGFLRINYYLICLKM